MGELRDKKEVSGRTNSLTGTSLSSKRLRSISFPSSLSLTETCCFFLFDGCMMLMDQQQDNKKLEKNADSFPLFVLVINFLIDSEKRFNFLKRTNYQRQHKTRFG